MEVPEVLLSGNHKKSKCGIKMSENLTNLGDQIYGQNILNLN